MAIRIVLLSILYTALSFGQQPWHYLVYNNQQGTFTESGILILFETPVPPEQLITIKVEFAGENCPRPIEHTLTVPFNAGGQLRFPIDSEVMSRIMKQRPDLKIDSITVDGVRYDHPQTGVHYRP